MERALVVAAKDFDNTFWNLKGFIFFRKWWFQRRSFLAYKASNLNQGTLRKVPNARPRAGFPLFSHAYPTSKVPNWFKFVFVKVLVLEVTSV